MGFQASDSIFDSSFATSYTGSRKANVTLTCGVHLKFNLNIPFDGLGHLTIPLVAG